MNRSRWLRIDVIDLEQAINIVQDHLNVGNQTEARFGTGRELLAAREFIVDLEYGWYIGFSTRGDLEGWPDGSWKLLGGHGPYIVIRDNGDVFWPRDYARSIHGPWQQHILDFEQNRLGVIRIAGVIHPTMKYTGKPDLSFLPAFQELEQEMRESINLSLEAE